MDMNVVRVDENSAVSEAIKKMLTSEVWSVLVERDQLPVGVLTERDIIRRAVAKGFVLEREKVGSIMTSPLVTVGPDASIGEAMELMAEKDIRRLFVVENGKIIGRITQTALFDHNLNIMLALLSMRYQI
jgi:CBS domain-containing protein